MWSSVSCDNMLIIHGCFLESNEEFHLFNVYAPCDSRVKKCFWDSLSTRLDLLRGKKVCVCGEFNVVQCREERRSVTEGVLTSNSDSFNQFIEDNVLFNLPLCGRKFTWFKGDDKSMSWIDRFLFTEEWCLVWPNCLQIS